MSDAIIETFRSLCLAPLHIQPDPPRACTSEKKIPRVTSRELDRGELNRPKAKSPKLLDFDAFFFLPRLWWWWGGGIKMVRTFVAGFGTVFFSSRWGVILNLLGQSQWGSVIIGHEETKDVIISSKIIRAFCPEVKKKAS